VWSGDGWLFKMGALDFAGGTVVHINAGIAALVTAIMLGKRRDYKNHAIPPHNITYVVMGAAMLWVGWFGFNAGSGLAADGLAANALMVTHIAAAAAAVVWAALEWIIDKRATVVGISTGAVGGLVAITPAAGFVGVGGALIIGLTVAVVCFFMVAYVKPKLGYDDSLDAFGVHGIGGILGAILTGILATPAIQSAYSGAAFGNMAQLGTQAIATLATVVFSGVGTYILFKITDKLVGVRVTDKEEAIGLDETQHGETAYTNFD
jgi:Amt family ammonium transporter